MCRMLSCTVTRRMGTKVTNSAHHFVRPSFSLNHDHQLCGRPQSPAMIIPPDLLTALSGWNALLVSAALYLVYKLGKSYAKRYRATPLAGPPSPSWLFGIRRGDGNDMNGAALFEEWAAQYGSVYRVPAPFGSTRVVLMDPKAISHFYTLETFTYVQTKLSRIAIENLVSRVGRRAEYAAYMRSLGEVCYGRKASPTRGRSRQAETIACYQV